jgi:hypothetical protein
MKQYITTDNDKIILTNSVDIEQELKENQIERNQESAKGRLTKPGSGMKKVASIPIYSLLALGELGQRAINGDRQALRKILSEHPEFRTSRSRI